MEVNPQEFHLVFKPSAQSELADLYSGKPTSITELYFLFREDFKPYRIHGLYTSASDAEKEAERLFKEVQTHVVEDKVRAELHQYYYEVDQKRELLTDVIFDNNLSDLHPNLIDRLRIIEEQLREVGYYIRENFKVEEDGD